ncbi:hypothetical protein BO83DRAFT_419182 [Aspergillus eucalypticola CBS 122712]|uniref:Uncharacterized protein n=1 Tax=Aspergillus eucalypticola (strain CBS 122712 / IBT 29274) TaxID=1448314 RepID=A0A317V0X3_ASPEC|nr:uncharacterized protein BO83DRAFT_419182 [Aspergillus eucalypticola CBS 122712]PWY67319.1 hypothetical protein BO83DRAFT_419182 [Aspergillus eucalypticola CBS 122712]
MAKASRNPTADDALAAGKLIGLSSPILSSYRLVIALITQPRQTSPFKIGSYLRANMGKGKKVRNTSLHTAHEDMDPVSVEEAPGENETIRVLQERIAHLQEELDDFKEKYRKQWWTADSSVHGWEAIPIEYDQEFEKLFYSAKSWTDQWVEMETAALAEFSTSEKQTILQSLEGYCVQDLDWDTFIESLPYPICEVLPRALAQTMLVKDIVDKFFENPFWYFEGKPDSDDTEAPKKSCLSLAEHLQHVYQQFLIVNPKSASLWKTETVRLANSVNGKQADNTELGRHTKSRREESARSFASAMLKDPPFRMLLRECEDTVDREATLIKYYERAERMAIDLSCSHGTCTYRNLTRLASPLFRRGEPWVTADYCHSIRPDVPRLDGHRILFILQPAVSRIRGAFPDGQLEEWTQAVAVIEDAQCTKEVWEKRRKEQSAKDKETYEREEEEKAQNRAILERETREMEQHRAEENKKDESKRRGKKKATLKQEMEGKGEEGPEISAPKRARGTRGATRTKAIEQENEERVEEEPESPAPKRARRTRGATRTKAVQQVEGTEDGPSGERVEAKRGRWASRKTTK